MRKEKMYHELDKIVRTSSCFNEVACRFLEMVCVEHLRVNPNSCDPDSHTQEEKEDIFRSHLIHW